MFDKVVDGASAAIWNLRPSEAVYLGRHEYDGLVPELTEEAVGTQVERLGRLRESLRAMDLSDEDQRFDREHLLAAIDAEIIRWEDLCWWRRNPMEAIGHLDITLYLTRDYAPFPVRAERAAALLDQAPRLLVQAREALEPNLPTVYCEWAVRQAIGMAQTLEMDLPALEDADQRALEALGGAGSSAAAALREYAAWVEADLLPSSTERFAVGGALIERMIGRGERMELSLESLLAMAEEDLAANAAAFGETAALIDPSLGPGEVYERHVASEHPGSGDLVSTAASMLEELRSFVVDRGLVGIPSETRPQVEETPRHLRWAFAMMSTPGPYETEAVDARYYLTPVDPDWSPEQASEWLRALNCRALEVISAHEVYPGHYLHFLHVNRAPTQVSRRFGSYAFVEGWAHYVEQLMWEEGYRDGDPRFRLAQLAEALVRDCRFVCAIRMHAFGMTLDEATRFFMVNALYPETPARREAERGSFDPGYLSYTLGKLEILRLRDRVGAAEGGGFDLRRFHDRLLSRGAPPLGMMHRLVMTS